LYLKSIKEEESARQSENTDVIRLLAESGRSAADIIAEQVSSRKPRFELPEIVFEEEMIEDGDEGEYEPMDDQEDVVTIEDHYCDPWEKRGDMTWRGGGWVAGMAYERAVKSSFSGLFVGMEN
jgi:hypothetical protein